MAFFRKKALEYGVGLTSSQLDLFLSYLDELWEWNQRINLTGLSARKKVITDLFLDSLIPASYLPRSGLFLDVGSGAGFPGIPLKIISPRLITHLLEANSKKVSFLRQIIRLLKLRSIEVIKGRIEESGDRLCPDGYNVITARALAPLHQTIKWCAPFLRPEGFLVTFLGRGAEEDLEENRKIIEQNRLSPHTIIPYFLPGKGMKRSIIIFKRKK
ncbi:MAG: 16S rRNA (guanine(527)-N(7))-methyltransferase RsmG [Pseudomonadota bacterium]